MSRAVFVVAWNQLLRLSANCAVVDYGTSPRFFDDWWRIILGNVIPMLSDPFQVGSVSEQLLSISGLNLVAPPLSALQLEGSWSFNCDFGKDPEPFKCSIIILV